MCFSRVPYFEVSGSGVNVYMYVSINPRPVHVGFVVNKVTLGPPEYLVFDCQYHFTNAQYSFIYQVLMLYNLSNWQCG
jgi:hypothetical protein